MVWFEFATAFLVFLASHSLPVRPPIRAWLVARIGARVFVSSYSVLSILALAWLIIAASRAPYVEVWQWAPWQNHLAVISMFFACIIFVFAIGRPNPFSFGGRNNEQFDPTSPGIIRVTRHPFLAVLAIWSTTHMIANGDLAHIVLFGSFAVFSLMGGRAIDRRKRREMGSSWGAMWQQTQIVSIDGMFVPLKSSFLRLSFGLLLFLLAAHPVVFVVSPLVF